ncbi:dihydroneopterin aldolase [Candidatus Uhrbacteria bacterium]|nr:dihydroneopterin aldolase [Candidatus Uhrbacteria bacterium]
MWKPVFQDISIRLRSGAGEVCIDRDCLPPDELKTLLHMLERVHCSTIVISKHKNRIIIKKRWYMQSVETRIQIEGLELFCLIGVPKIERSQRQSILADIDCTLANPVIQSDRMQATLNYSTLAKTVHALVEAERFVLLETLAEAIAKLAMADLRVAGVSVQLRKRRKLPSCDSVGVTRVFRRV